MKFLVNPNELKPISVSKQEFTFLQDFLGNDPTYWRHRAVQQKWIKLDESLADDLSLFDDSNDEYFGSFLDKMNDGRRKTILKSLFLHLIREGYDAGLERVLPYLKTYEIDHETVAVNVNHTTQRFSFLELAIAYGRTATVQHLISQADARTDTFELACQIAIDQINTGRFYGTLDALMLAGKIFRDDDIFSVMDYALKHSQYKKIILYSKKFTHSQHNNFSLKCKQEIKNFTASSFQNAAKHDSMIQNLKNAISELNKEQVELYLGNAVLSSYLFSAEEYKSLLGPSFQTQNSDNLWWPFSMNIISQFITHSKQGGVVVNDVIYHVLWDLSIENKKHEMLEILSQLTIDELTLGSRLFGSVKRPALTLSKEKMLQDFINSGSDQKLAKTIFKYAPQEYKKDMLLHVINQRQSILFQLLVGTTPDAGMLKLLTNIAISNQQRFDFIFSESAAISGLLAIHMMVDIYNISKTARLRDNNTRVPKDYITNKLQERITAFLEQSDTNSDAFKTYENNVPDYHARVVELFEYAVSTKNWAFSVYLLEKKPDLATRENSDGDYILSGQNKAALEGEVNTEQMLLAQDTLDSINSLVLLSRFVSANYIVALLQKNGVTQFVGEEVLRAQGHTHAAEKLATATPTSIEVDPTNISVLSMLWFCLRSIFHDAFEVMSCSSSDHTLLNGQKRSNQEGSSFSKRPL